MKHLLLEGAIGCGKTTLILKQLAPLLKQAGGFVAVRLLDEYKQTQAFCLVPASCTVSSTVPFSPGIANVFLERDAKGWQRHDEVFLSAGLSMLSNTDQYAFMLLDEMGGFELLLPEFYSGLCDLLSAQTPCIGVLKAMPNQSVMSKTLGISNEYTKLYKKFRDKIERNPLITLINMSEYTPSEVEVMIQRFIEHF